MFRVFRNPLIAICLIVFGIFLIYTGHTNSVKFAALRDHGKTAKAEVVKLEWKEKKITHVDSQYTAHIHFTTEDGRDIRTETGVPAQLGSAMRNGSAPLAMTVRYLPESPSTLQDVNQDDTSDAQNGVGRYMLCAGLAMLAVRYFLSRSRER
ncbi:DUF3592 domain-containing protein [Pseudolysobacter antarcticus]|uniref:DUF3592 domain-containing protein n=1 Tax=Pseudolysobacter antarcticus TaxID=2511995 RepID=A0A411HNI8_9GAMM|nr:DUF3592 domain-containing protein [Pseudolysobacter antarcticus]QBB72034.1 DUF3592 domain-containing protein [Pseudolysobacter antarcticus]